MAWYDSQLVGVIVGGIIGGFGKIYFDLKSDNQLKISLERGIKSEVKILKESVDSAYRQLSEYEDELKASGKPNRRFRSLGEFRLSFTGNTGRC